MRVNVHGVIIVTFYWKPVSLKDTTMEGQQNQAIW